MTKKRALIIGAGPAGLTAAFELLQKSNIKPLVFEKTHDVGGISKTVNYKGNRIDIGGHRFFSKSDRVMSWWMEIMPMENHAGDIEIAYQGNRRKLGEIEPNVAGKESELVFLIRNRLSRIFYQRSFFDYPITLSIKTIKNLGLLRMVQIGFSYIRARLFPIRNEKSLEDFFINRFGRSLYLTFFKDYTEKVWGESCKTIGADWGRQRIKGLSATKALLHAVKSILPKSGGISQKNIETSLIEYFMYPKYGPGQLWEEVCKKIQLQGGEVEFGYKAVGFEVDGQGNISSVRLINETTGEIKQVVADYVISTMPVRELIAGLGEQVPKDVAVIASGLKYRDFLTVGLLLDKLALGNGTLPDNWIYIQERDVKVGRVQVFNNWSPFMVDDPDKVWIGLEYFCNEGDSLWVKTEAEMIELAKQEMEKIGFINQQDVLDATVIKMEKAYPGYFGESYDQFDRIRHFTDSIDNLFLIGRNGMHKYNNQDHSMLSAMAAVENICNGRANKANIWSVNTEQEYHESK